MTIHLEDLAINDGTRVACKGIGYTINHHGYGRDRHNRKPVTMHRTRHAYRWVDVSEVMFQKWYRALEPAQRRDADMDTLRIEWMSGYQDGIDEKLENIRSAYGAMGG